jgi:ABC-type multidrug transport system fused ATPase/permease subunit
VVVIDEATANIDVNTDRVIQAAIRSMFQECTVLTIAHRINTIMHCDRVMVMGEGTIRECDSPQALIRAGGEFARLYQQHLSE